MRSFSNGLEKHRREIINISQTFDSNNRYILFNYNQSALEPQATAFYEHFTQDHLNSLKSSGRFNSLPIGKQSIVNEPRISIPEDQNKFIQEQTCCKAFRLSNIWLFIIIIAPVSCIVIGFLYRNKCPLEKWIPLWQIVNGIVTLFFLILIFITRQISTIIVVSTDVLSQDDELNNGTINNLYNTNTTFEKSSMFKINNGFLNSIRNKLRNMKRQNTIIFITDQIKIFIILFLLAWFICGSIWVYRNYTKVQYKKRYFNQWIFDNKNTTKNNRNFYCAKTCYFHAFIYMTTVYVALTICLVCFLIQIVRQCLLRRRRKTL